MNNYMFGDKKNKIKDTERSLISETVSIEGTINSSGAIDVAGLVKGPVISKEIVIRETGSITGSIEGDRVEIHGHMDGKISGDDIIIGRGKINYRRFNCSSSQQRKDWSQN